MSDLDQTELKTPQLTFLRRLVTILTLTMIGGIITLVTLIFMRFQDTPVPLELPESIMLPDGSTPLAFTRSEDWYAVVTKNEKILVYDLNGVLFQIINVEIP